MYILGGVNINRMTCLDISHLPSSCLSLFRLKSTLSSTTWPTMGTKGTPGRYMYVT